MLTLSSSEYLPKCKERSSDSCKFPANQQTLQSDWTSGHPVITCELKTQGKSFPFTLFSFYTIFSDTETHEKPLNTTPYEKFG